MRIKGLLVIALFLLSTSCSTNSQGIEVTVNVGEFAYDPSAITVFSGQVVALTFKNNGALEHDFVVGKIKASDIQGNMVSHDGHMANDMGQMNYDLHVSIPPGESAVLRFAPTESGAYEFYCTVAGHKEAGMAGTLIVKNP